MLVFEYKDKPVGWCAQFACKCRLCSACGQRLNREWIEHLCPVIQQGNGQVWIWRGERENWAALQKRIQRAGGHYAAVRNRDEMIVVTTAPLDDAKAVGRCRAAREVFRAILLLDTDAGRRPITASAKWKLDRKKEPPESTYKGNAGHVEPSVMRERIIGYGLVPKVQEVTAPEMYSKMDIGFPGQRTQEERDKTYLRLVDGTPPDEAETVDKFSKCEKIDMIVEKIPDPSADPNANAEPAPESHFPADSSPRVSPDQPRQDALGSPQTPAASPDGPEPASATPDASEALPAALDARVANKPSTGPSKPNLDPETAALCARLREAIDSGQAGRLEPFDRGPGQRVIDPGRFARALLIDLARPASPRVRTGVAQADVKTFLERLSLIS